MKKINSVKSNKQSGASAIEYAIIASVIALTILVAAQSADLGGAVESFFETIKDALSIGSSNDG